MLTKLMDLSSLINSSKLNKKPLSWRRFKLLNQLLHQSQLLDISEKKMKNYLLLNNKRSSETSWSKLLWPEPVETNLAAKFKLLLLKLIRCKMERWWTKLCLPLMLRMIKPLHNPLEPSWLIKREMKKLKKMPEKWPIWNIWLPTDPKKIKLKPTSRWTTWPKVVEFMETTPELNSIQLPQLCMLKTQTSHLLTTLPPSTAWRSITMSQKLFLPLIPEIGSLPLKLKSWSSLRVPIQKARPPISTSDSGIQMGKWIEFI